MQNDAPTAIRLEDTSGDDLATVTTTATSGTLKVTQAADHTAAAIGTDQYLRANFTTTVNDQGPGAFIEANDKFYFDIISFGDGTTASDRVNNSIYRMEVKESDDNTSIFTGTIEFVLLNQLNVDSETVFLNIDTIDRNVKIIVHEDLTDEDSPRVNYLDLGADGVSTQVSDQVAAPTHSGVVSFDAGTYKTADTVNVTLEDQDLNVDADQ